MEVLYNRDTQNTNDNNFILYGAQTVALAGLTLYVKPRGPQKGFPQYIYSAEHQHGQKLVDIVP